jgi:hypothetical protein
MLAGATVAVIVPAYQEERMIGRMLAALPGYVDIVVVVDDASTDSARIVVSFRSTLASRARSSTSWSSKVADEVTPWAVRCRQVATVERGSWRSRTALAPAMVTSWRTR